MSWSVVIMAGRNWYIGSTPRHIGVPECTRALTHTFEFNNLDSLKDKLQELDGKVAAVILEPMNVKFPEDGFLEGVKELTHQHNAVLIFDEVVTGFRHANGGAQEYFGVIPDLVSLGKGLANGYPLSAIAGKSEIMDLLEEVYFSFTYGGETLSLAAALATLTKLQKDDVVAKTAEKGERLNNGVRALIEQYGLEDVLTVSGHPSWSFLQIQDYKNYDVNTIKTFFMQEMMDNGILTLGSHLLSYAHTDDDIDAFIASYDSFMKKLKDDVIMDLLRCEPLKPLFKVRKDT